MFFQKNFYLKIISIQICMYGRLLMKNIELNLENNVFLGIHPTLRTKTPWCSGGVNSI